ncbi:MAG: hypothetical protein ACQKBT_02375, partial [Puniceicoccales bacterium]
MKIPFPSFDPHAAPTQHIKLPDGLLIGGHEQVTPAQEYHWDGMRRSGDPDSPFWLFQYTLKGFGIFQNERTRKPVLPGQAFFTLIPSPALYCRASECDCWEFFWILVRSPYLVDRFRKHTNLVNEVVSLQPSSAIFRTASDLYQSLGAVTADNYQREELLFRWMLECERWASRERHPPAPKVELLDFVRTFTLKNLEQPL